MGTFSLMHWLIVLLIIVILFGAKRLPMIGEGLGKMFVNFKKASHDGNSTLEEGKNESTPTMINSDKQTHSTNQNANT